ncbi:hypothetical protein MUK42_34470 [Musa troglodytarum]|uniref:Uncharacterized protein n=1 Tax=Musa troglodytarum TaxID=320322 RepID=A0A9E7I207_9LILI|nr:hypothetical protein MUK42_34470 [Musa troglodytarum]
MQKQLLALCKTCAKLLDIGIQKSETDYQLWKPTNGYRKLEISYRKQETKYRLSEIGNRLITSPHGHGNRKLNRLPAVGYRKPKIGYRKSKIGYRLPEIGYQKQATGNRNRIVERLGSDDRRTGRGDHPHCTSTFPSSSLASVPTLSLLLLRTTIGRLTASQCGRAACIGVPRSHFLPSTSTQLGYTPIAVERIRSSKVAKPALKTLASLNNAKTSTAAALRDLGRGMDDRVRQEGRVPLKEVVADGTRRWFQDALKEARVGDAVMQVLVGQMHHSGYGVLKNDQKDVSVTLAKLEEPYKPEKQTKANRQAQSASVSFILFQMLEYACIKASNRNRNQENRCLSLVAQIERSPTEPSRAERSRAERSRAGPVEPSRTERSRASRAGRAGQDRSKIVTGRAGPSRRPGQAAGSSRSEAGQDRNESCPTRLGPAQLGSNRLGSAPTGSARLGSRCWGVSHANNASDTVDSATRVRGIVGMRNAPARARARVHPPSLFARLHFERSICSPTSPSKTTSSWF